MAIAKVQDVPKTQIVTTYVNVVDVMLQQEVKQLKNKCSRIEIQGRKEGKCKVK
jgi:hypothetical protein